MGRNVTITEKQILEAARTVFLEEGFGAQTAKIALRAGISEGSIFKRFSTKEALFFAALQIEQSPVWHAQMEQWVGTGECRENLLSLFVSLLLYFNDIFPRFITTLGSRVGVLAANPFEGLTQTPPERDLGKLSHFLRQEMDLGRLRDSDAEMLAHLILGTLSHHIMKSMHTQKLTQTDFSKIAEASLDLIWGGIAPP